MEERLRELLTDFLHQSSVRKLAKTAANKGSSSITLEFRQLLEYDIELAKFLLDKPEEFLRAADEELTSLVGSTMRLRISNLGDENTVSIRDLRESHLGKFIQIEGIIAQASPVRPEICVAVYRCKWCGELQEVEQTGEFIEKPLMCLNPECSKRTAREFELVEEKSKFRDWQALVIQEKPEDLRSGRMPRRLDCIVRDDLVERAVPGNRVRVTGYMKPIPEGRGKKFPRTFRKIFFINHLEVIEKGVEEIELTQHEIQQIKKLAKDPNLREKLIKSIAPAIFGCEHIKEGILLQLFGSDPVVTKDGHKVRGDIHILLVGDPGKAKSALLRWVAQVAPRGLYTSGVKSTAAGLTATAVKNEVTGTWALEAGALVLADGGIACIDEFEKMDKTEANAILESLEQQTISVSKGGIVATLNTRTSVCAAANPKTGRIDTSIPLVQQIDISPVLISRFDLIFAVKDTPDPQQDQKISEHMVSLHGKHGKPVRAPIPADMLRKIIVYAKKYIHPQIKSKEVVNEITRFYVEWRKHAEPGNPVPVTPRQLETIIRLAKANARARLSEEVQIEDVNRAIQLLKLTLQEIGYDLESGRFDIDLIYTQKTKPERDRISRFRQLLQKLDKEFPEGIPHDEIVTRAQEIGLDKVSIEKMIEEDKNHGFLFEFGKEGVMPKYKLVRA